MKKRNLIIIGIVVILLIVALILFFYLRKSAQEYNFEITQQDLEEGWYYGSEDQKKIGTPDDWFWMDAGRSSRWFYPKCPTKKSIDCMPGINPIENPQGKYCEANYRKWIEDNCDVEFLD